MFKCVKLKYGVYIKFMQNLFSEINKKPSESLSGSGCIPDCKEKVNDSKVSSKRRYSFPDTKDRVFPERYLYRLDPTYDTITKRDYKPRGKSFDESHNGG